MTANGVDQYTLDAAELRLAFDQVFATPDVLQKTDLVDFLCIRVGAKPFALRVTELTRIEALNKIVPLPGGNPLLLGLTSSQGKLLPVVCLELALGFDRTFCDNRWLAVCGQGEQFGLAFDTVESYLRVAANDIITATNIEPGRNHAQQTIHGGSIWRNVIMTSEIVAGLVSESQRRQ